MRKLLSVLLAGGMALGGRVVAAAPVVAALPATRMASALPVVRVAATPVARMAPALPMVRVAATPVARVAPALPAAPVAAPPPTRYYYLLRIYHGAQLQPLDSFLQTILVPALHRAGIPAVGVFKPVDTDTATYVLIPFTSLEALPGLDTLGAQAAPLYSRMESVLMRAFPDMPAPSVPPRTERVYELRSYESATEALHENKLQMFNEGGEVPLFKRLGFNAVFYADVLSGAHMPNLMYMTSFESKADREQHWQSFNNDPEWKRLVALPEYQHNVSKADITFLRPEAFSDF